MKAAIYCRVSTEKQEREGFSLEAQKTRLPKLARERGYTDYDLYQDVQSGARDDRPGYTAMLERIQSGEYQAVFVIEKSRLTRTESLEEEGRVLNMLKAAGCVVITPHGEFNPSTIDGEFSYRVMGAVDAMERQRIKMRVKTGRAEKRKKGGNPGQAPATGYRKHYEPDGTLFYVMDDELIAPVRLTYQMALEGAGATRITRELNKRGYQSGTGRPLTVTHVYQWLRNPTYAGYVHIGMSRGSKAKEKGMWPAEFLRGHLVTLEEWQQIQQMMDARKQSKRPERYPLSGILRCPSCGDKMIGGYKGSGTPKVRYYVCQPDSSLYTRTLCPGMQGKSIKMSVAHQMLIDALPRIIDRLENYQEQVESFRLDQQAQAGGQEELIASLKRQLGGIERRIMTNIREQEEDPSDYRRQRIKDLESQAQGVKQKIKEAEQAAQTVEIPDTSTLLDLIRHLEPTDNQLLDDVASPLFTKLNYSRSGTHRKHTFSLTSCEIVTGQIILIDWDCSYSQ